MFRVVGAATEQRAQPGVRTPQRERAQQYGGDAEYDASLHLAARRRGEERADRKAAAETPLAGAERDPDEDRREPDHEDGAQKSAELAHGVRQQDQESDQR